jgi:poly(3-hydroxybutyrate) depolymerase
VAATLSASLDEHRQPQRPVSVLIFQGTGDPPVPWPGGLQYLPQAVIGKTSRQIDAGEVL